MASRTKRLLAGFLFLQTVFLFTIAGGAIAVYYDTTCENVYESRAVFHVTPKWVVSDDVSEDKVQELVGFCDAPHEQLIASPADVEKCFVQNNLFVLDSLRNLPKEECISRTVANLEVAEVGTDTNIFQAVLRSSDPNDAQTILNNLVDFRRHSLQRAAPELQPDASNKQTVFSFNYLEDARYGENVWPGLPTTFAIFVFPAIVLAIPIWFFANLFRFKYPRVSLLSWLVLFLMTAVFVVGAIGLAWWFDGMTEYESTAKVLFENVTVETAEKNTAAEKRLAELSDVPHEILFQQYNQIERSLERNNLFVLDIFEDFAMEDCIDLVQQDLSVSELEESGAFEIRFRSLDPDDSQTVLANLIASYSNTLAEQHQRIQDLKVVAGRAAVDAGENENVFGAPVLAKATILEPASKSVSVLRMPKMVEPFVFLGVLAGLFSCVLWFAWRATCDITPDKSVIQKPVSNHL